MIFRHSDDNGDKYVERWINLSADASQCKENTIIIEKGYQKINIISWLMIGTQYLEKITKPVKAT